MPQTFPLALCSVLLHNEARSNGGIVMLPAVSKENIHRVSVTLADEMFNQISARAAEKDLSLNRTILQLLRAGLASEQDAKQRLAEKLQRYRECTDTKEAQRLGDELGAMIFAE